jgi:hypothetical protein
MVVPKVTEARPGAVRTRRLRMSRPPPLAGRVDVEHPVACGGGTTKNASSILAD